MLHANPPGSYNAKVHAHLPKLKVLLTGLSDRGSIIPKVVVIHHASGPDKHDWDSRWVSWDEFTANGKRAKLGRTAEGEIEWQRLSFNWPLWILFSSGTTGKYIASILVIFLLTSTV